MHDDAVTVQQVDTADGIKWRICRYDLCVEHGQRWQAELMLLFQLSVHPANSGFADPQPQMHEAFRGPVAKAIRPIGVTPVLDFEDIGALDIEVDGTHVGAVVQMLTA